VWMSMLPPEGRATSMLSLLMPVVIQIHRRSGQLAPCREALPCISTVLCSAV
jgi:hypothetical protein